jgi:predicted nucleic acid-binding protein
LKVLLDTNIIIHREAATVINEDIGVLFRWLDNLHYSKYVHPVTISELAKHEDPTVLKTFNIKIANYNVLKTIPPIATKVSIVSSKLDQNENDKNDTLIINDLYCKRVDVLITEDKKLHTKASLLNITGRVYTVAAFLEKVKAENPGLVEYTVLSVKNDLFGNLNLSEEFFTSLKEDYPDFEDWFNKKADESIYVCRYEDKPIAILYLKIEKEGEDFGDIDPPFQKKKRLKIGTFKVELNGYRLGERFLKIIFDNALRFNVDEIYVTTFNQRVEQQRLIKLFEEYGFQYHGYKNSLGGQEHVYVRSMNRLADLSHPKSTYPFFSTRGRIFMVSIYPKYHTELFPDSILNTESPADFIENEPYRNTIGKIFISRSIERNLESGDLIIFYRTGGYHKSVITTIGIVENIVDNIATESDFIRLCRKRTVFDDSGLSEAWNFKKNNHPFIVNFLYTYSFPRRMTLKRLIEVNIIPSVYDAPQGFLEISKEDMEVIIKECQADESLIVH